MVTWKLLLITLLSAVVLGCIVGVITGKHQVKKARGGYHPLLTVKERVIYSACIVFGAVCILYGVFVAPGQGAAGEGMITDEFGNPIGGVMEGAVPGDVLVNVPSPEGEIAEGEIIEDGVVGDEIAEGEILEGESAEDGAIEGAAAEGEAAGEEAAEDETTEDETAESEPAEDEAVVYEAAEVTPAPAPAPRRAPRSGVVVARRIG